jgi:hypothetical protein
VIPGVAGAGGIKKPDRSFGPSYICHTFEHSIKMTFRQKSLLSEGHGSLPNRTGASNRINKRRIYNRSRGQIYPRPTKQKTQKSGRRRNRLPGFITHHRRCLFSNQRHFFTSRPRRRMGEIAGVWPCPFRAGSPRWLRAAAAPCAVSGHGHRTRWLYCVILTVIPPEHIPPPEGGPPKQGRRREGDRGRIYPKGDTNAESGYFLFEAGSNTQEPAFRRGSFRANL